MPIQPLWLRTHPTEWNPSEAKVAMNLCLEGGVAEVSEGKARLNFGHVVVLDDFVTEETRIRLFEMICEKGWTEEQPPSSKWERETCDQAGLPKTWGLKDEYLAELARADDPALQEVHARLCKLYPEVNIAHLPADSIQGVGDLGAQDKKSVEEEDSQCRVECNAFVANAAVHGDCFQWHLDADPFDFPPSEWVDSFGTFTNGDKGKPLLVSLLLYLNEKWCREWDAETLFLDSPTETGIFVRPKPGRAILMDQDVLHRVSMPSVFAKRPRFSLVWKLVFFPTSLTQTCTIARPAWGQPVHFGSASRVQTLKEVALKKRPKY